MCSTTGRIFLIANHPGVQDALALLLKSECGAALTVVGQSTWSDGALAVLHGATPTILIGAVGIAAYYELGVLESVRGLLPEARIVIVDTMGEAAYARRVRSFNVDLMLSMDQLPEQLLPALRGFLGPAESPPAVERTHTFKATE